jgi:hypothetical protein
MDAPVVTLKLADPEKWKVLRENLETVKRYVGVGVWSLAGMGLEWLKELTPRSAEGNNHLADQYRRLGKKDSGGWLREVLLYNIAGKGDLLKYLEFGTKPHIIRGNPILHFFIGSEEIFCTIVHHPGTKPYAMIATTRARLELASDGFQETVLREYVANLGRPGSMPRAEI